MAVSERSYEKITGDDLARLAKLAAEDRQRFFVRNAQLARLYRRRILCTALCRGAALHYVNEKNGSRTLTFGLSSSNMRRAGFLLDDPWRMQILDFRDSGEISRTRASWGGA